MSSSILVWIFLAATVVAGQQTQKFFERKKPSGVAPFAWPSTWADVSNLNLTKTKVLRFLKDLDRDSGMLEAIQSFRFVPLEKDRFYLVADVDASGNGLFGTLEIVRCERASCIVGRDLSVAEDLETDLVDVDLDGAFEVITKESPGFRTLSTYGSPPFVYAIKSLIRGELVDVSAKYSDYFKSHILARMEADRKAIEAEIANVDRSPAVLSNQELKTELQYVQDDYHRRVLGERTAGLDNALKWARSNDEGLREFGVKALEPIDSSIAAAELLRIANTGQPGGTGRASASDDARNALLRRAQKKLTPPPANGAQKQ